MPETTRKRQNKSQELIPASAILETIRDDFFALDREWRFLYVNQQAAANLGSKPEELIGQSIWQKLPGIIGTEQETLYRDAMRDGQLREFETRAVAADRIYRVRVHPFSQGILVYSRDITEPRLAQKALQESEQKYRTLFENMAQNFVFCEIILDGAGNPYDYRFLEANPAALKSANLSREYIGKTLREITPLVDTGLIDIYGKVALTGEPIQFERLGVVTGKWFSVSAYSPRKGYFAVFSQDITERKKIEKALIKAREDLELKVKERTAQLTESEEKYRNVVENANEFVVVFQEGLIKYVNKKSTEVTGYSEAELLSRPFTDFIHPDDRAMMAERYKKRAMGETVPNSYEFRILHKDGSTRHLLINAVLIQWQGKPATLGLMSDITERKQAQDDLRISEEKYRTVVENANEVIVIAQDGTIKFVGGKALELTGYSPQDLVSRPFLNVVHPDDRKRALENYQALILGEAIPGFAEFRVIRKNGMISWVQMAAANITWENRTAVLALFSDITERKNMEQELKVYAQKITQVQEDERKRVAYELHDDTAQYLSILKLQLDSLISSGKIEDPGILEKLQLLEKDAGRAVNDVRRYSHELRPGVLEHLGLQAALEQIAEDINKLKQVPVSVNVEGIEPELSEGTKLGFFRIAQEAIHNAGKHARADKITVDLSYDRNYIEMVISDNGTGFDVQKEKTKIQTGIRETMGLTSMQERAKLIAADLKIESCPGQGTKVIVQAKI